MSLFTPPPLMMQTGKSQCRIICHLVYWSDPINQRKTNNFEQDSSTQLSLISSYLDHFYILSFSPGHSSIQWLVKVCQPRFLPASPREMTVYSFLAWPLMSRLGSLILSASPQMQNCSQMQAFKLVWQMPAFWSVSILIGFHICWLLDYQVNIIFSDDISSKLATAPAKFHIPDFLTTHKNISYQTRDSWFQITLSDYLDGWWFMIGLIGTYQSQNLHSSTTGTLPVAQVLDLLVPFSAFTWMVCLNITVLDFTWGIIIVSFANLSTLCALIPIINHRLLTKIRLRAWKHTRLPVIPASNTTSVVKQPLLMWRFQTEAQWEARRTAYWFVNLTPKQLGARCLHASDSLSWNDRLELNQPALTTFRTRK